MATTVVQYQNQTIKINGSGGAVLSNSTVDLTAPASGYLIVTFNGTASTCQWSYNGGTNVYAMTVGTVYTLYVGQGMTLRLIASISNTVPYNYVTFVNSLNGA